MNLLLLAGLAAFGWFFARRSSSSEGGVVTTLSPPGFDRFAFAPEEARQSGRVLAAALPPTPAGRDAAILALAAQGFVPAPTFVPVSYSKDGHDVTILAATSPLMLGAVDPVRLTVTHGTAQELADFFGAMLPTSRMADAAYSAAIKILPQQGASDAHMGDTSRMIEHSDKVSVAMAGHEGELVRDQGKDWVNTERLVLANGAISGSFDDKGVMQNDVAAANFGWHTNATSSRSPGGMAVLQSVGLRHNMGHVDYSQVVTLYGLEALIDGQHVLVADALRDPQLGYLLSDEVLKGTAARVVRHPAIPEPFGPAEPGSEFTS